MHVSKWGDALAVKLPKDVVEALDIKPGDELSITTTPQGTIELKRPDARKLFLEKIAGFNWPTPENYAFNREEANER